MIYKNISPLLPEKTPEHIKRIILFDPSDVYSRITIKKFSRHQSIPMEKLFPTITPGVCCCGCEVKLTGRQTRWASKKCTSFALGVFYILRGDTSYIFSLMSYYTDIKCCRCGCENYSVGKSGSSGIQVDHILAVKNGGGGGWLGNYRFICHKCHSEKTKMDNNQRKNIISKTLF